MIAVIADDLTGAAELGGVAFARGLRASVQTRFEPLTGVDVVVIDTGTRSRPPAEAASVVARVAAQVKDAGPDWIYKKVDSLLRGPVAAEIEAVLSATGLPRCLLVPANPSRGRLVQNGELWLGGRRLHETDFAHDPEYPRLTSRVRDLLKPGSDRITVPDLVSQVDLHRLVERITADDVPVLWAGASDFFQVLLDRHAGARRRTALFARPGPICGSERRQDSRTEPHSGPQRVVLISGSRSAWNAGHGGVGSSSEVAVRVMPAALTRRDVSDDDRDAWTSELTEVMMATPRVLVAIGCAATATAPPAVLAERLAIAAVEAVRHTGTVQRVLAEGGATAGAVAAAFGWMHFDVRAQPARGVVLLEPRPGSGPEFMIKVGSYEWPATVWGGQAVG
jgi:uncharacterized protein YgbK (DUF1537 family)